MTRIRRMTSMQRAHLRRQRENERQVKEEQAYKDRTGFTVDQLGALQLLGTDVLGAVARGELDLNAIALEELANRGMDERGDWIGFEAAAKRIIENTMIKKAIASLERGLDDGAVERNLMQEFNIDADRALEILDLAVVKIAELEAGETHMITRADGRRVRVSIPQD